MGERFTRSARKHRIGKASARFVMATTRPIVAPSPEGEDERRLWVGVDERGRELESVAIVLGDDVLVIHVMPTHYRGSQG